MDFITSLERLIELLKLADFTADEIVDFCVNKPTFERFLEIYERHHI